MPPKKSNPQTSGGSNGQMKLQFGQKQISAPIPPEGKQIKLNFQPQTNIEENEISNSQIDENLKNGESKTQKRDIQQITQSGLKDREQIEESDDFFKGNQSKQKKRLKLVDDDQDLVQTENDSQSKSIQIAQKSDQNGISKEKIIEEKKAGEAEEPFQEVFSPYKNYEDLRELTDDNFCPIKDSPQQKNQRMPFSFLVRALQLIEKQEGKNSRTIIVEIITNIFRSALVNFPQELGDILYFFIVKLAPDFAAIETGVGHEVSVKAIAKACGKAPKDIRELYKKEGDLGIVAQLVKSSQTTLGGFFKKKDQVTEKKQLQFNHVFKEFRRIANSSGDNSTNIKESIIIKLLQDASNDEAKYIIRFLQKTLKTGAAEKTVITALARAILYTPPNKKDVINQKKKLGQQEFLVKCSEVEHAIKQAICECSDYQLIVDKLMIIGDDYEKLKDYCKIRVGVPVKPMLAKPTTGVSVVLKRFEGIDFTCEYKYDGFRGQIHYNRNMASQGKDCHIYSRNLENMSVAYPDVMDIVRQVAQENQSINNFILDSELIAFDTVNQKILPFQQLTQRSRKHVNEKDLQTKIAIMAFDILYYNDKSLLKETFESRRKTLHENFNEIQGQFMFAKGQDTSNFEDLEAFLEQSVKDCCEGLMVKTINFNSTYEPSKRSFNWLKLKKDYINNGLGDTIDLVVVGADHGSGKRAGWFGSFLLAAWNEDLECFQTVCKCGTGFSDELFTKLKPQLEEIIIDKPAKSLKIKDNMPQVKCDVYFEPKYVWEVKAADLSLSPMHTACSGVEEGKGIALRFPRMMRERDDKSAYDTTTTDQLLEMYKNQASVMQNFNDDDDYDF